MTRLASIFGSALVASLVCATGTAEAQAGDTRGHGERWITSVARTLSGSIEGTVQDDLGRPLVGVTVSAFGPASAVAMTDPGGSYRLRALPPGPYLVRAHLSGYLASRRQLVEVRAGGPSRHAVALRRLGLADVSSTPEPTRVLAASFSLAAAPGQPARVTSGVQSAIIRTASASGADPDEVTWRLRHLNRSVLKDTTEIGTGLVPTKEPPAVVAPESQSPWSRTISSSLRAGSVLASLPLSAEVKFLTTGALDGADSIFSPSTLGNNIAYLSLSGPVWGADWSAKAVLSQGATGSWFLAADYKRREPAEHLYDAGFVYSVQRFAVGPRGPRTASPVGSRSAILGYGYDRWTIGKALEIDYGAHFARYGYLDGFGLLSPRIGVALVPVPGLRVRSLIAQRLLAPGAEEFLQPIAVGLWVPPGRTFIDVSRDRKLGVQQTRHYELSVEQALPAHTAISVRTFRQQIQSQQAALFGTGIDRLPEPGLGHYLVSRAGDVDARGWSVGLSNTVGPWLRGQIHYEVTEVDWVGPPDTALAWTSGGYAGESGVRQFHDITTSIETDIPYTATRVFVLYKVNSAFARADASGVRPGFDARFDLQITQRLPFLDFTAAEWQVLVAVRNLFREGTMDASVLDELLVVCPPKRVVGGVLVRF